MADTTVNYLLCINMRQQLLIHKNIFKIKIGVVVNKNNKIDY